ncbi:DUF2953 domain-containing protein [Colidextribacter sp. OB.20]|uniref:DUF2953 domain-containing protein n=1 Tax=Colidextribacter sp. OB.20 TaxID=2304568 RepID=UPI00136A1397|nr:DUF2953 domain-containing protein [Colidextribacter sp. OB.20]NBI08536.1 DUF2953 domain-containing protein [Colidextribacter sp. OB.20]
MRALYILAAIVLILFLIGQIRVGCRARFNAEGFFLWARLGRLQIKILPMKPREEKPKKPQKPKDKKPKKPKEEKPPTPLPEKLGGALEYAQALLPVGLEAAKGLWRDFRIDTLELELTAGSSDPADAAMLYGQANAALGALWLPLTKAFHVKDGTARVRLDFDSPGMTVYGLASFSLKLGNIVWIGLRAGVKALFGALAAKKRLKLKRQQRKAA